MKRRDSLGIIVGGLLAGCQSKNVFNAVRVGSTTSDENATIAEIYSAALERRNIRVERHARLGEDGGALAALQRGTIDLYPGLVESSKPFYDHRYGIISLAASPANDSPCLLTSQVAAEQFWLLRLTKCSTVAPQLRLAATREFLAPGGVLERLRHHYGGFEFKTIVPCDPGAQIYMLNKGDVDVANGYTTDPNIAETQLVVLNDDKHFWPIRHPAPVVRTAVLTAHPQMQTILDSTSRLLSLYALQQINTRRVVLNMDPSDAADDFVSRHLDRRSRLY